MPMARYPDFDKSQRIFNGTAADAFSDERATRWQDPAGGFIHAMHRSLWGGMHYQITGKDASGKLTTKAAGRTIARRHRTRIIGL